MTIIISGIVFANECEDTSKEMCTQKDSSVVKHHPVNLQQWAKIRCGRSQSSFDDDLLLRFKAAFCIKRNYIMCSILVNVMARRLLHYWCRHCSANGKRPSKCEKTEMQWRKNLLKITVHSGRIVSSVRFALFEVFSFAFFSPGSDWHLHSSSRLHRIICEYYVDEDGDISAFRTTKQMQLMHSRIVACICTLELKRSIFFSGFSQFTSWHGFGGQSVNRSISSPHQRAKECHRKSKKKLNYRPAFVLHFRRLSDPKASKWTRVHKPIIYFKMK